jgi:hypothetical protein
LRELFALDPRSVDAASVAQKLHDQGELDGGGGAR